MIILQNVLSLFIFTNESCFNYFPKHLKHSYFRAQPFIFILNCFLVPIQKNYQKSYFYLINNLQI